MLCAKTGRELVFTQFFAVLALNTLRYETALAFLLVNETVRTELFGQLFVLAAVELVALVGICYVIREATLPAPLHRLARRRRQQAFIKSKAIRIRHGAI